MVHRTATSSADPPPGPSLDLHHREIEQACLALLVAGLSAAPRDLARRWNEIERSLLDHLMAEEQFLFPDYAQAEPEIAQELRRQHARLRERAFEIGTAIDLHMIRSDQLRRFLADLRAHAQREGGSMYRWAECHVSREQHRQLRAWLAAPV